MSKTVDERIVSMQFDNKNFESNVKTSMGTLEKLKKSLKLTEAAKGLENVSNAAKKFDIKPIGNGVEAVKMKFSSLEVMAVTTLANITNSAVNAGKKFVAAFTIDPIKSGFQEYETQINAVQTILANTSSKGTTIDQVNEALDTLNTYADKTIYNFTEMTRNIGTFTAAGVDLETSVSAIQGIANLAAVSGSTSQQASTAMYQLSQALASGTVKLMDWNSVVNAGMGGQVFQDALKKTSELLGTGAEAAIKANGSFRESLSTGWLTADVLTETLKKFTTSGANEYVAEYCGISAEAVQSALDSAEAQYGEAEAIDKASEALARKSGKSKDEIKSALEMARTAEDAATKVKTFTQLFDTLKEAVQSGWTQSFEIIIGDFEEAKEMLTGLSDFFGGIINSVSDARNRVLEGAMGSPLGKIVDKVSKFKGATTEATKTVNDFGNVIDDIMRGKLGDGETRFNALTKAGYNWAEVQNEVNKRMGSSVVHAVELTKTQKKQTGQTEELTDAKLKELGLTNEEIKLYRDLEEQSKKTGKSINELVNENMSGRDLLIGSFKNVGSGLVTIFKSIGEAWNNIFGISEEEKIAGIYNGLKGLYNITSRFSETFKENGEEAEKLRTTFQGLFAALDLVRMVIGGGLNIAFKILRAILGYFNMDILDLTSMIGQAIINFRDWVKSHDLLSGAVKAIIPLIIKAANAVEKWVKSSEGLQKAKNVIRNFVNNSIDSIKEFIKKAKESENIPKFIIDGLVKGLTKGVPSVAKAAIDMAKGLFEAVCEFLDIHSPSRKFMEIGGYVVDGLVSGIQNGINRIKDIAITLVDALTEVFDRMNFDKVFGMAMGGGGLITLYKMADAFQNITNPLKALGDVFESVSGAVDKCGNKLSKALGSLSLSLKAKAVKDFAISLAILVGAIALLTIVDEDRLWDAVRAVGVLSAILVTLTYATSKLSDSLVTFKKGDGLSIKNAVPGILAIATSLLIVAGAIKLIGKMDPDEFKTGILRLVGVMAALGVFIGVIVLASKKLPGAENVISGLGATAKKLAVALLLMVAVVKLASKLDGDEILQAAKFMIPFGIFLALLVAVSRFGGEHMTKIGKMATGLGLSMLLLATTMKIIGKLEIGEIAKGLIFMKTFFTFITVLTLVSALLGKHMKNIDKLGKMASGIGAAMLLMAFAVKIVGEMEYWDFIQGITCVGLFTVLIVCLIESVKTMGKNGPKMAATITSVGIAIGILAGVCAVLGLVDPVVLLKGVVAIGVLSAIMVLLIKATKDSKECADTIKSMAIAIAVMGASLAVLSFLEPSKLASATLSIAVLMGMFTLMEKSAKDIKNSMGAIIAMDVAIGLIAAALFAVSQVNAKSALAASAAISIVLLSLSGAMMLISKVKVSKDAYITLGTIAGTIIALGLILALLSNLPTSKAASSIALLSVSVLALAGAMMLIGKIQISPTTLVTLGIMTITIATLGVIMSMLSSINTEGLKNIALGLLMLIGTLASLAIALNLMTGCLAGAAALVVVTMALTIFIPVLMQLCMLEYSQVAVGLIALAGALAIIGVAGTLLTPAALGMIALGASIALLGSGVLMTAQGLEIFVNTLMTCINGATEAISGFIDTTIGIMQTIGGKIGDIIQAGIDLVFNLIEGIGQGIEDNAERLREVMISFAMHLWNGFCAFFGIHSPSTKMAQGGVYLIQGLIKGIIGMIPAAIKGIISLGIKLVVGLGSKIGDFLKMGKDFIVKLIKGIGSKVKDGVKAVKNFAKSLISGVKEKASDFIDAGKHLIGGLVNGIKNKAKDAVKAAKGIAKDVVSGVKNFLGIHSPSRVFEAIGEYVIIGFAKGLEDKDGKVKSGATALAKTAVMATSAIKDSIPVYNASSDAIKKYTSNLYLLSDAYKKEQETVENSKDKIDELKKSRAEGREEIKKQFNSIQELYDKQIELEELVEQYQNSNTKAGNERLKQYQNELNSVNSQIKSFDAVSEAKKEIQKLTEENAKIDERINQLNSSSTSGYNDQASAVDDVNTATQGLDTSTQEVNSSVNDITDSRVNDVVVAKESKDTIIGYNEDIKKSNKEVAESVENIFESYEKTDDSGDDIVESNKKVEESNKKVAESAKDVGIMYGGLTAKMEKYADKTIKSAGKSADDMVTKYTEITAKMLKYSDATTLEMYKTKDIFRAIREYEHPMTSVESRILSAKRKAEEAKKAAERKEIYDDLRHGIIHTPTKTDEGNKDKEEKERIDYLKELSNQTSSTSEANTKALEAEKEANSSRIEQLKQLISSDENYKKQIDDETDKIRSNASYLEQNNKILDKQIKKRDKLKNKLKAESNNHKKLIVEKTRLEEEYKRVSVSAAKEDVERTNAIKARLAVIDKDIKLSDKRTKKLNVNLKSVRYDIKTTKEYIAKNEEELAEQTKEFYKELSDGIKDNVNKYTDPLKMAFDSGVSDLFSKFEDETANMTEEGFRKSSEEMIKSMQSQVDGVKEWQSNLKYLAKKLDAGLLEKLKELGPSASKEIQAFMHMTNEEFKMANKLFEEEQKMSTESLLNNYRESAKKASDWNKKMSQIAKAGFDKDILSEIGEMDIDKGLEYMDVLLNMTNAQIAEFNQLRDRTSKIANKASKDVISSYEYAGSEAADAYRKGIEKASNKKELVKACIEFGKALSSNTAKGMKKNMVSGLVSSISDAIKACTNKSGDKTHKSFETVGKYSVTGFAKGIKNNLKIVKEAAEKLANEAYKSAMKKLDAHSPSKVFIKVGSYIPQGFAMGIDKFSKKVANSSMSMADAAIDIATNSIRTISDVVNGGLDIAPTITPVIDMDSKQMDPLMLTADISAMVMKPIDTVQSLIGKAQEEINASNNRVIDAINGLREDLQTFCTTDDKELALYVDSKKMASALVNPMNRQLNVIARRQGGL